MHVFVFYLHAVRENVSVWYIQRAVYLDYIFCA